MQRSPLHFLDVDAAVEVEVRAVDIPVAAVVDAVVVVVAELSKSTLAPTSCEPSVATAPSVTVPNGPAPRETQMRLLH